MDLIGPLRRFAFARPHLLLVEAPGAAGIRIAVEAYVRTRGWSLATSPADADALVEVGELRHGLAEATDVVERQMTAPSVRIAVPEARQIAALDAVPARLASWRPTRECPEVPDLPMAERADDRDGLMLDVLRVPLGPVLPHWPAGLRVVTQLQGDVIQAAEIAVLGAATVPDFWAGRERARGLDAAAQLVGVAGWAAMSVRLGMMRDRVLAGEQPSELDRVLRRLRRSGLLRSALTGLAVLVDGDDAYDRLGQWIAGHSPGPGWRERLPHLLTGVDLGVARLIVASLGVDTAGAVVGERDG